MSILIKNATVVTMDRDRRILQGNVYIENDKIVAVGDAGYQAEKVIDGSGQALIPGLIQPHIHLCQTLFRGQADDLELLDWLKLRIWPLEGAHDPESIYYSALLGCGELFMGGTTSIVDMETVRHTDAAIQAIADCGMRAITGKVMMDHGQELPASLREETGLSIQESVDLLEKWHGRCNGRILYAFTPRFVVSCSEELLAEVGKLARQYGVKIHTHASENRSEIQLVERERGMRNVVYLHRLGLTGPHLILAHCIWMDDTEMDILTETGTRVVHCPSSNMKLASGIARIPEMLDRGITVGLAADGAPCNNNLDEFQEMRLSALMQKPLHGPTVMPAEKVFELATIGGARAMGLDGQIGSIEAGKKADLALVNLKGLHNLPDAQNSVYSQLVYQLRSFDVTTTIVDGRVVMEDRQLTTIDQEEVRRKSREAITRVKRRAGIS
ncbi:N-ethylammeline chlorohydrolase [Clostridiales bacterium PH28_bin88]|nr:N-ethylammeline chlorohydrolase [Clostridiales bacterium PH28_bin88]